ncbi:MAG TPA: DUF5916 domain-containing protein [Bacteroidales bacterium]|nr:DUF5916 domain-containing protein [Bacteroidales bacterium]
MQGILNKTLVVIVGVVSLNVVAGEKPMYRANAEYYKRTYVTETLKSAAPVIDGKLDDECWQHGSWSEQFVQQTPDEGGRASEITMFKVLFDKENIYVAFRCYDSQPDKIQNLVGKRDELIGDMVGINFDSYFDKRFGYEFNITAGGSKIDQLLKNDGSADVNWNAVWYGATAIGDSGWTAEMQIPLSQLRYNDKPDQIWGLHAWRWISRHMEEDQWSLIPRNNSGFIYSFGELHGLKDLQKSHSLELMPYILVSGKRSTIKLDNPFNKKYSGYGTVGLDGKIAIGSDFTLNMTLNPDFGQVEADPSVMNLSAFETFLAEKRPFFLEGKNVMDFNIDNDILFYSRRIGHQPMRIPDSDEGKKIYTSPPSNTSILDAVKLTGKTANGLSIGIMQSTTNEEFTPIDSNKRQSNVLSEPYTNYFLARVQKDYKEGNTIIGGILTSTNRFTDNPRLNNLAKDAYCGGLDFVQYLFNRNYVINAKGIFSYVQGDSSAITDLQRSAVHYFQRPDNKNIHVDSTAKYLSGNGGSLSFSRTGKNKLRFEEQISWRSPGLDINDLGFINRADFVKQKARVWYNENVPNKVLRMYYIGFENEQIWNYEGIHEENSFLLDAYLNFINKWETGSWIYRRQSNIDTRELRGGPAMRMNPFWHFGFNANTDWSKKFASNIHYTISHDFISGSNDFEWEQGFYIKPINKFNIGAIYRYAENYYQKSWADDGKLNNETKYVMAKLVQKTMSFTLRLNLNLTPDLSIQYYGNPFISNGSYSNYKLVTNAMASNYYDRFVNISDNDISRNADNSVLTINENGQTYTIDNPDFNKREFHSNLVLRWEYRAGSVFYVVWSHQRSNSDRPYPSTLMSSTKDLLDQNNENIIMFKLNYYLNL